MKCEHINQDDGKTRDLAHHHYRALNDWAMAPPCFANAPLGPPREKPNITAVIIYKGRDIEPAASLSIGFNSFSRVSVLDSCTPILF